jgi:hypothetical protein
LKRQEININLSSRQPRAIAANRQLTDTVTLWSNAKFITVDEFKKEIDEENARYGLSRKFKDQHIVYNENGEIVINYKNFIITTQKVIENNSNHYFISMTFWDILIQEDVSNILSIKEIDKIISFLNSSQNIQNLQNEDIVSFEDFKIIKSSDRFYISINDIYYGERLTEVLYNKSRNEFELILLKLENAKTIIGQNIKKK